MGQQQLLLLVLGIVIVGIAVVAGIQAFSEGKVKAERDAAVSDAMRFISDVQAWSMKPKAFGGGDAANLSDVSWAAIGITDTTASGHYMTVSGCFDLGADGTNAQVIVYADTAASACDTNTKVATVTISDETTDGISWAY